MGKNNVLIIGDAMLDAHVWGEITRISPEAPVPVVNELEQTQTLGGAANVAAQVSVVADKTIIMYKNIRSSNDGGEDEALGKLLKARGIKRYRLWMNADHAPSPIPVKQRVWAGSQQVCRIDRENPEPPTAEEEKGWIEDILRVIWDNQINKVIFSDYDKGTLSDGMISNIAGVCMDAGILTILDPKRASFPTIQFLTVVKPNEKELLSTGFLTAEHVSHLMDATYVVATHGEKDTTLAQYGNTIESIKTTEYGAVDVCGAGDVHVAILALKFSGSNIKQAVHSANAAASISVQHHGCYTLTEEEVRSCLKDPTS